MLLLIGPAILSHSLPFSMTQFPLSSFYYTVSPLSQQAPQCVYQAAGTGSSCCNINSIIEEEHYQERPGWSVPFMTLNQLLTDN